MGMVQEWSKQYGIEESFMAELHTGDSLHLLYRRSDVLSRILGRNSQLVQEWLADIPRPSRNVHHFGINIVFLLPTSEVFDEIFQGMFHPKFKFEEKEDKIATCFFDESGVHYFGPSLSGSPPTYLEMTGTGDVGFGCVNKAILSRIENGYFIYSAAIGYAYDQRKDGVLAGHREVGVGGLVLWYCGSGRWYNPSSTVQGGDLKPFWDPKQRRTLEAKIKQINKKFFRKAKEPDDLPSLEIP